MRYVLLLRGEPAVSAAGAGSSLAELNGQVAFFAELARELRAGGELVEERALAGPEHARWVTARGQGHGQCACDLRPAAPPVEQFLVAYWVVDCDAPERAMEIPQQVSARPGFSVEIRPVLRSSGEEM